jgi:hypothetical protein
MISACLVQPSTTNCIPEHCFSLCCFFVCIISWKSLSVSYQTLYMNRGSSFQLSHDPLMAVHCMALLLLFCCPVQFNLYIVCIFFGVAALVKLLDPENGGIMFILMFITIYQLTWCKMHIHVLRSQYKFCSSSLPSFHALSPFTKEFFNCLNCV